MCCILSFNCKKYSISFNLSMLISKSRFINCVFFYILFFHQKLWFFVEIQCITCSFEYIFSFCFYQFIELICTIFWDSNILIYYTEIIYCYWNILTFLLILKYKLRLKRGTFSIHVVGILISFISFLYDQHFLS